MDAHPDPKHAPAAEPAAGNGAAAALAPSEFRDLSPRWLSFFKALTGLVGFFTLPAAFILLYALSTHRHYGLLNAVLTMLLPGWLLVVIAHECGHWLAARWRGMIVTQVMIGPVEIQPCRRGIRMRLRGLPRGVHGYVMAYADDARDMRRDLMWLAMGGPLANLLAAAICGALALALGHSPAQALWILWGLLQLATALFNLIPRAMDNGMVSDGLNWLRTYVNRVDDLPGIVFMRINGRILRGKRVIELPAELTRHLSEQPEPMPAVHDWLEFYRAVEQEDLDLANATFERMRARIDAYDEPVRLALGGLFTVARIDWACMQAIARRDEAGLAALDALDLKSPVLWYLPYLAPRVRALAAALRGNGADMHKQLAESKRHADNAQQVSIASIEAVTRGRIEALLDAGVIDLRSDSTTDQVGV